MLFIYSLIISLIEVCNVPTFSHKLTHIYHMDVVQCFNYLYTSFECHILTMIYPYNGPTTFKYDNTRRYAHDQHPINVIEFSCTPFRCIC
jgi:hypothetical protein